MSKGKKKRSGSHKPLFVRTSKPSIPRPVKSSILKREVEEDLTESIKAFNDLKMEIEKKTREKTVRQMVKIMCFALNQKYEFGYKRMATLVDLMADLILEGLDFHEGDTGDFWFRIDSELAKRGMNFYPSEDELNKKEESQ